MWKQYNPNPSGRAVGDCAVRALTAALGVDWDTAYILMTLEGFHQKDMLSSNSVWGAVLRQHGFTRHAIPNDCPDCFTFEDFANEHPQGTFVLGTGSHTATVKDGVIHDSWDSRNEIPQYYWRKE